MSSDPRDYKLDISGLNAPRNRRKALTKSPLDNPIGKLPRAWISVHFECCGVYQRI